MAVPSWYRPSSNPLSRLQSLVTMLSVSLCLIEVFFVSPCSQWAPLYSRGFVQQRQSSCLTLSTTQRKTQDMHSVRYLDTRHKSHTRDLELKNTLPQDWSMSGHTDFFFFNIDEFCVYTNKFVYGHTDCIFIKREGFVSDTMHYQYVKAIHENFRLHPDLKADPGSEMTDGIQGICFGWILNIHKKWNCKNTNHASLETYHRICKVSFCSFIFIVALYICL